MRKIINWFKHEWMMYDMDCYYAETKATYFKFLWSLFWYFLQVNCFTHWVLETYCDRFGHDWHDESHGGPDSGCMAGHCKRCGYSFYHQLY